MPFDVKSSNPEEESLEFICDWCGKPIAWSGQERPALEEPVHQEVRYGTKGKRKHYYVHRLCELDWLRQSTARHAKLLADDRAERGADPTTGRNPKKPRQQK